MPQELPWQSPSCRIARVTKRIPGIDAYIAPGENKMRLSVMIVFTTFKLFWTFKVSTVQKKTKWHHYDYIYKSTYHSSLQVHIQYKLQIWLFLQRKQKLFSSIRYNYIVFSQHRFHQQSLSIPLFSAPAQLLQVQPFIQLLSKQGQGMHAGWKSPDKKVF